MKHFKFLALMLTMIASVGLFSSCSSDDDSSESKNSPSIVGTWRLDTSSAEDYKEFTFTSDGKVKEFFYYVSSENYEDGVLVGKNYTSDEYTGTYVLSGNDLVINETKRIETTIDGKTNKVIDTTTSTVSYTMSRTILSLTSTTLMWKYKYVTDSGDVMTATTSYTKVR